MIGNTGVAVISLFLSPCLLGVLYCLQRQVYTPLSSENTGRSKATVRVQAGLTLVETATAHNLPSVSKRICSTSDIVVLASTI